ncbi:AT-rich interactive domain-containing protein 2 isoform X2 [Copidosoma floridanum]|uniref:AT-rich interactive domain-containing protein 2 isoform X2 n=1 Tax=Copidosoma floridanum TaxID=29053 RepID=UPI0006C969BF|nr:AT-rich interactive domain-containing protein 2 isoform X2 [Copidosoma floridanum]
MRNIMALQQQQNTACGAAAAASAGVSGKDQQNNAKDSSSVSYERMRESFMRDLQHFHDTRGTSFKKNPKVNGRNVDLYKLYTLVTSRGGWIQVNSKNEWTWLCEEFHLPNGCVNSGVGLKQIYLRYLDRYEKVHYLGEDGHQADDDDEDSRHRKWNVRSLHSVPHTYNHNQHNVADSLREYNGLSSDLYKPSSYDKLALSLLSPLPNEQDFAINVCTFLSNEGKHTLRLDKYPRLIAHLIAHAGVFDSPGTRQLFIEVYSRVRNYSINSFWQDVLDSQDVLDLTDERLFFLPGKKKTKKKALPPGPDNKALSSRQQSDDGSCPMDIDNGSLSCDRLLESTDLEVLDERLGSTTSAHMLFLLDEATCSSSISSSTFKDQNQNSIKFEEDDRDLFCVGRTFGTQDPYGQRVLQIASILRNLSFTPENAAVLGRSPPFLRFVLLCVRARWSNLHQLGFDTLGNVASEIVLKDAGKRLTSVILQCVARGISSQDRFVVISCLEILNKISLQDLNEDTLVHGLDDHVYELICRFLALSDIALLVYTLECLYALTSLGEKPCTSVARVRGAIDTLVALVTVEAQSYGPKACILMRVVETVSSVPNSQQQPQQSPSPQSGQSPQPVQIQASPSSPHVHQQNATTVVTSGTNHVSATAPTTGAPTATNVSVVAPTQTSAVSSTAANPVAHAASTTNVVSAPVNQQTQQTPVVQVQQQQQQRQTQVVQVQQAQAQVEVQQQAPAAKQVAAKVTTASNSSSRPSTPKNAAAKVPVTNSLQQQHAHQQIIQENEQFALGWLKANFEPAPGVKIEQEELYKKYLGNCTKIGRRGVIAPLHFPRCVRSVFGGTIGPNPLKGDTSGSMFYEGIKLRVNPGQVSYPSQSTTSATNANQTLATVSAAAVAATGNVVTVVSSGNPAKVQQLPQQRNDSTPTPSSSILKAQLSAPPKPQLPIIPLSSPLKTLTPVTSSVPFEPKSQVSVAHPHLSQALLASGAQQQQQSTQSQQQATVQTPAGQQVMQVIVEKDGRAVATTSSSIIKSLLATKVTASGECMQAAAASQSTSPCVSAAVPVVTNATGVVSSISANQLLTANQVVQRQQQQRQQQLNQQQITGVLQTTTSVGTPVKIITNAKSKPAIVTLKKFRRLNGAKVIVANNCEKVDSMETDSNAASQAQTAAAVASITTPANREPNNITSALRVYRPAHHQQVSVVSGSTSPARTAGTQPQQPRNVCTTPIAEDSDSTNNSIASSSGIGGSRDLSGVGAEEDNSLTSFEGILQNGAPSNLDIDAQEDGSSKDSSSAGSKDKPLQGMMLADLLERKVDKEPVMNGLLGGSKKDLVENHIKMVLKDSSDVKIKTDVSEDTLMEAPQPRAGIKRSASIDEELAVEVKKPKYANGTTSPDPAVVDSTTISSIKSEEDEKEEKVTVSSTAANLYAALAADIIDDETDLEDPVTVKDEKPVIKEEVQVKEELPQSPVAVNQVVGNQIVLTPEQQQHIQQQVQAQQAAQQAQQQQQQQQQQQKIQQVVQQQVQQQQQQQSQQQTHQIAITQQQLQQQLQQGLLVASPRQIVVQQAIQANNQIVTIPTSAIKGRQTHQIQSQVLQVQQGPGGQTHYVISGGVPGQSYMVAQPQTALVQGQAQTVLVAQQQGTNTKTIIILQPQATAQPQQQKMVAVTPQGQQVVVTQVQRPILQNSSIGQIPPPLVPTSGNMTQASIVMNSAVAQQIQQQQQLQVHPQPQQQVQSNPVTMVQTQQVMTGSVPSRVVTPTPANTPPPTRPTTPHQAAATQQPTVAAPVVVKTPQPSVTPAQPVTKDSKDVKIVTTSTSGGTENKGNSGNNGSNKSTTSQQEATTTSTITSNSTTRAQTTSTSAATTATPTTTSNISKTITIKIDPTAFLCEWRGCLKQFKTPRRVFLHVCEVHCPNGNEESLCLWPNCDTLKRRRFSLMTHLLDKHCCEEVMLMRRKQLSLSGKTEVTTTTAAAPVTTHHPGYAPNAAFHAIKRHALEFVNPKELMDDNEGPVTKSIRLTAALILRNLVIYSAQGRRHLRAYEPHLAGVALSNVESSRTIAQVLYDMNDQSSSGHR